MKKIHKKQSRGSSRKRLNGKSLTIRELKRGELPRFKELNGKFHYMGEGHSGGDTLRLIVEYEGEWIALFLWGSAAYRLKDRDDFIGWSAPQRAQRQKLIVQNRRFTILAKPGEYPNLASCVLGKMLRELPDIWHKKFGYMPLLAETFSDIETQAGTCYKASGWLGLGKTKGFSRHRADFYIPNDRPKKLWVKELRPDAAKLLRSQNLPQECQRGAKCDADGVMPLKKPQIQSLHAALRTVPDPRAKNRKFQCGAMLSIVAMAVLSGHRDLSQVVRFAKRLTRKQRETLGLPLYAKDSSYRCIPSYSAFYNLLTKLDIDAFSVVLSTWLQQHTGSLPTALALDGKFIRNTVGIVCMADHETGVPEAMIKASKKEGEGKDCEIKAAQKMICRQKDLSNKIITADAMHCQHETARAIVERGGEYIFQVKNNQKTVRKEAALKTENLSPFLTKQKKDTAE